MSNKTTTAPSFAEEGLEDIQSFAEEAEQYVPIDSNADTGSEDEFVQVGGNEPISFFFRFTAPKKPTKSEFKILEKGTTLEGVYERSFTGGKFNNTTYIVRLSSGEHTGKLVGLPSAGQLSKAMAKVAEGSDVRITYTGVSEIKNGKWAGSDSHTFVTLARKRK